LSVNNLYLDVTPFWLYNGGMIKLTLRLPKWLHDRLQKLASDESRSLNGQIVYLLARAVGVTGKLTDEEQDNGEHGQGVGDG
jgi:hypothetical protein